MPEELVDCVVRSRAESRRRLALAGGGVPLMVRDSNGWYKGTPAMGQSQQYPPEFCLAIAELVHRLVR